MAHPAPEPAAASNQAPSPSGEAEGTGAMASPVRPVDPTPVHTDELPPTPQRTRTIPATAWVEAPAELLELGRRFGGPGGEGPDSTDARAGTTASFLRRVGPWLLWRAGPARGGDASYWAARATDLSDQHTFLLFPDGTGDGVGPSGERHARFRAWKEDLRDHG